MSFGFDQTFRVTSKIFNAIIIFLRFPSSRRRVKYTKVTRAKCKVPSRYKRMVFVSERKFGVDWSRARQKIEFEVEIRSADKGAEVYWNHEHSGRIKSKTLSLVHSSVRPSLPIGDERTWKLSKRSTLNSFISRRRPPHSLSISQNLLSYARFQCELRACGISRRKPPRIQHTMQRKIVTQAVCIFSIFRFCFLSQSFDRRRKYIVSVSKPAIGQQFIIAR